jgi:hypothetical protein
MNRSAICSDVQSIMNLTDATKGQDNPTYRHRISARKFLSCSQVHSSNRESTDEKLDDDLEEHHRIVVERIDRDDNDDVLIFTNSDDNSNYVHRRV